MRAWWLLFALLSTLLSTVRVRGFSLFGFGGGGSEGQKAAAFLEGQREMVAHEQARGQTRLGPEGDVHASLRCTNPHSNKSHLLFASRVDDGVCDCCSGIDEPRRIVLCPDTCLEQAQHEVALRATRQAAYHAGSQVRAAAAASALARLEAEMAPAPSSPDADPAASLEQLTRQRDFQQKAQTERLAARDERINDVRLNTRPRVDAVLSIESWEDVAALAAALMDLFGVTRESVDQYVPAEMVDDGEEEDAGEVYEAAEEGAGGAEADQGDGVIGSVCLTLRSMDHRMEALPCPHGASSEVMLERLHELSFRLLETHAGSDAEAAGRVQMLLVHYRLHGVFGEDAVRFAREANVSDLQSCLAYFPAAPAGPDGSEPSGPSQAAQMNCDMAAALSQAMQLLVATKQDVDNNEVEREAIARGAETLRQLEADIAAVQARADAALKARRELEQFDGFLEFLAMRDDGVCLRRTDGSYSYSACVCDSVYQQDAAGTEDLAGSTSGSGSDGSTHRQGTSLGSFDRLERNTATGGVDMHFKVSATNPFGSHHAHLRITHLILLSALYSPLPTSHTAMLLRPIKLSSPDAAGRPALPCLWAPQRRAAPRVRGAAPPAQRRRAQHLLLRAARRDARGVRPGLCRAARPQCLRGRDKGEGWSVFVCMTTSNNNEVINTHSLSS